MIRTVAITGGASGIGAATVSRLTRADCDVFNLDIAASQESGVTNIHCDLSNPAAIDTAIVDLPTTIDTLVCVAGVAPGSLPDETIVTINFLGLRHLVQRVMPRILDNGNVVIVASSAGRDWPTNNELVRGLLETTDFEAGLSWLRQNHNAWCDQSYKFSKQCAAAWTHRATGLARDRGVRVNCVSPGIVETQLSDQFRDMVGSERYDWIVEQSGRVGTPDDIAPIIEFLAIGDGAWLNGVELTVDGGYYSGTLGGWIDVSKDPSNK